MPLRRADLSPEELADVRRKERDRLANLAPDARERYVERKRKAQAKAQAKVTPEKREATLAKDRVANMTPEQREKRTARKRIANMADETRLEINMSKRVANLTPDEQEKARLAAHGRRASRTPEQQEAFNSQRAQYRASLTQEEKWNIYLWTKYRMRFADFMDLANKQGMKCPCGDRLDMALLSQRRTDAPVVDHCHKMGYRKREAVRGIMHLGCNLAIGHAGEDAAKLRLLAEYVLTAARPSTEGDA